MASGDYFKEDILQNAISEKQKARAEARNASQKREKKVEKQKVAAENRKKRSRFLWIAVALLVVVVAVFGSRVKTIHDLTRERKEAQAKLDSINNRIAQLEDELSRVQSPEYIEQQARNQLRMIYPGEILYVIVGHGAEK